MSLSPRFAALLLSASLPLLRGDGWDFLKQGKPALARTAFQNQLKKNPADTHLRAGLAQAELALGNAEGACQILLECVQKDGKDASARIGLARAFLLRARSRVAIGRGDEEETRYFVLDAENQARLAAELAPKDPEPCVTLAEARLLLGNVDEAKGAIDDAEKRGLEVKRLRHLRGEISIAVVQNGSQEGGDADYAAAKNEIEALIRDDPGSAELRLRLGDLHHAFSHWDEALDAWRRAFAIDPFDRPTLELLLAYLKFPELRPKARAVLETAMTTAEQMATPGDPRPGYPYFCFGQAKLADRELDDAAALFKKAKIADPSLVVPCSLGLAEADFKRQRHDEAAAAWKAAYHADAAEAKALLTHLGTATAVSASLQFLADQDRAKSRLPDARDLLAFAYDLQPDDPGLCNNYAFLCRETGKYDESWKAYSHLIELAPEQPRYLNDAALILSDYLKKDLPLAQTLYERAIASADKILADPAATEISRKEAADAKTDATSNLAHSKSRSK
jgi:tetratricopeptide (TPR) repeat protein